MTLTESSLGGVWIMTIALHLVCHIIHQKSATVEERGICVAM